ncbi:hypothetical protein JRI60_47455 [Archangium violaceum]|uniref:hypothetical protein n=1 Tax=Archangium violaceum TaxID=83451 RepID=UPI0019515766|nr:hypothetical protein [Archangium violaceum]QRN96560.1 hypothetical protein JRI60_47455 [Archangium violaceum]
MAPLSAIDPPCAYVLSQTGSTLVAMPAIPLVVSTDDAGSRGRTLLGYSLSPRTCSSEGRGTPALLVPVPTSLFERPETLMEVESIVLDLGAHPVSRPGHVLTLEGGDLLVLPRSGDATPSAAWDLPEPSITFRMGGLPTTAHYLPPTRERTVESAAEDGP